MSEASEIEKKVVRMLATPQAFLLPQAAKALITELAIVVDTLERRVLVLEAKTR
jgi:hypothetical protein